MKRSGKAHVAKIGRFCKRYVYFGTDWSKALLEANEPKPYYRSNERSSQSEFFTERALAVFILSESVQNGWRSRISETATA
ncbi:MAG TPA: hypothetical protein VJZ32_00310 [Candidatus Bathyarchaeia archaeon]|nr:hypothetical protein [Candidatus Bathyarchaeia archaeon]